MSSKSRRPSQQRPDLAKRSVRDLKSEDLGESQEAPGAGNAMASELLGEIDAMKDPDLSLGELLDAASGPQGEGMGAKDSFGNLIPAGWGKELGSHRGVVAYDNSKNLNICVAGQYGYKYQCVEYVNRFASEALGLGNMKGTGHAKSYDSPRAGLTWVKNEPGPYLPQDGDILVFKGGAFGHVAVATHGGPSGVGMIQQNAGVATSSLAVSGSEGKWMVGGWSGYSLAGWQHAGPLEKPKVSDKGEDAKDTDPGKSLTPSGKTATWSVRSGDTLFGIAQAALGDGNRYREIASLNGLRAPYTIVSGQTLKIPDGLGGGQAPAPQTPSPAPQSPAPRAPTSRGGGKSYTVRAGDSLWGIAASQLGSGARHGEIARLNGIGDGKSISPGQVLNLPA